MGILTVSDRCNQSLRFVFSNLFNNVFIKSKHINNSIIDINSVCFSYTHSNFSCQDCADTCGVFMIESTGLFRSDYKFEITSAIWNCHIISMLRFYPIKVMNIL